MDALARKLGIDPVEFRRRNFIQGVPEYHRLRPRRSTRATSTRHSTTRSSSSTTTRSQGAGRAADARGDTKRLGIGFSTYIEMCGLAPSRILGALRYVAGGWERSDDPLHADRHGAGRHRHVTARSGPCDDVLADRRRQAGRHPDEHRGAARRHGRFPARHGHLRKPVARRRRCRPLERQREGDREGTADRRAPARGRRRRHRGRGRRVHRARAPTEA